MLLGCTELVARSTPNPLHSCHIPTLHLVSFHQLRNIVVPFRVIVSGRKTCTKLKAGGDTVHDNREGGSAESEQAREHWEPMVDVLGEEVGSIGSVKSEADVTIAVLGNSADKGDLGILVQPRF